MVNLWDCGIPEVPPPIAGTGRSFPSVVIGEVNFLRLPILDSPLDFNTAHDSPGMDCDLLL